MHPAQIFVVLAAITAVVAIRELPGADEPITGSIETAVSSVTSETLSCDQPLYLEELELIFGAACS